MADYSIFRLGDFELVSGEVLPDAFIAYKTYGHPSSPTVIYPTWFSGLISDNEWLVGAGRALDPARYHIVIPAVFGNGQSSSPSNMRAGPELEAPAPAAVAYQDKVVGAGAAGRDAGTGRLRGTPFPNIAVRDNVTAQYRLVTEHLGVRHARLVLGWSMGAMQTYQWLTQYPAFMDLGAPFCGSARTSVHNQVFLEGVKVALLAPRGASSAGSAAGEAVPAGSGLPRAWTATEREVALKAMARIYAGWGMSQDFYRQELHVRDLGYKDLEDFLVNFWESWALSKDPENLLVMLHTWQAGDCSDQPPYNKDFGLAMRSIKAKTLVLPGLKDLYFPPEDSEYEVLNMSAGIGRCLPIPSLYGHWAGGPGTNPADVKWLDDRLKEFLAEAEPARPSEEDEQVLSDRMASTHLQA
ncbi:Homoserine O-acetyltransferase [Escovopsis weberi]|uniref:Homoserine O-acetyltransferase n=1 Tax=Escovopsis weberi TaxID=150374 RepID=A0A0M9VUM9_ESCWE|nr:Homoserine O-acetyltransferase [Escovopsis weberi]